MSETPQEQEEAEVEETTPPADESPAEPSAPEEAPTDDEVLQRTEDAVQDAGQPIPDEHAPGYGDEPQKDSADIEGSDEARRVHPDTGGYQYQGDDSAAQVNDQSADE